MYKKTAVIFILILLVIPLGASASVDKRYTWWKMRLEKLESSREELISNTAIDKEVISLLDRETGRAKIMTALFTGGTVSNTGDTVSGKISAPRDIRESLDRIFPPLFSLFYLNETVRGLGDQHGLVQAKSALKSRIEKMGGGAADNNIAADILENEVDKNDLKHLSAELFLGGMMKGRTAAFDRLRGLAEEEIAKKGGAGTGRLSGAELDGMIAGLVIEKMERYNFIGGPALSEDILESSWSWRHLENRFSARISSLGQKKDAHADAPYPVPAYEYRAGRNREYLGFFRDLYKNAFGYSSHDNIAVREHYTSAASGISRIMKFFHNSMSIGRDIYPGPESGGLVTMNRMKSDFDREIKEYQREILGYCRDYTSRTAREAKSIKETMNSRRDIIAQKDIDTLRESIEDHIKVLSAYTYGEEMISSYKKAYDRFFQEAKSGEFSDDFRESMKKGSIFQGLPGFDGMKLAREYTSRKYLKKECLSGLSYLVSVLQFYKKLGIEVKDVPSSKDLDGFRAVLNNKIEMKTGSWVMTDANYAAIDRNLVKELRVMAERGVWSGKAPVAGEKSTGNTYSIHIANQRISLEIPRGWNEKKRGDISDPSGLVGLFESIDRSSTIEVARKSLNSRNLKDVSEEWIRRPGARPVKKEWGKYPGGEYYWVLSRDGNKAVTETYAVENNGYVIFVTGRVLREKYQFFKGKFDGAFNSLIIREEGQSLN